MDAVDALVFALLAIADIALLVYLRRRRARILRDERMCRTLTLAIRRSAAATSAPPRSALILTPNS